MDLKDDNCELPLQSNRFCPDCFASYIDRVLHPDETLLCSRCGKRLKKYSDHGSLQAAWALVTASLIFLFMANVTPIMVFDVSGNTQSNLMITGVESLFSQGYWPLAILVFSSAIALPILHLSLFWYLLGGCCLRRPWPGLQRTLSIVEALTPWNLIPVFAVGVMVAVVKLEQLGNIEWRAGALWIALLAIVSLLAIRFFDRALFEEIIAGLEKS
jgi:paraquat-inducible protein A